MLRESSHTIHVKRTLLNKEEYIFDMVMKPTNAYKLFRVSSYIYMFQPQFNYPQGGPLQGLYYKNVFKAMHKSKIRANLISILRYLLCIILTTVSSTYQLYNFIRITFYTRILLSFHDGEILHNSYMEFTTKILSVLYILIFI